MDVVSTYEGHSKINRYKDCVAILKKNPGRNGKDGVYTIYPDGKGKKKVYCDMTTDGGGWTAIQRRQDGSADFYRTWSEYKQGFGDPSKNYWIGNDAIYDLTKNKDQELRVDLQRFNGDTAYALYSTFYIGDEGSKYKLTVSGYSGTAGDSLKYHNGYKFTTKDQDNDRHGGNCARQYHGGWWYKYCYTSNLNGQNAKSAVTDTKSIVWQGWKGNEALKRTVMMIRHKN
ncbi:ryncolin-1-like isoform X1 [Saccostrea cucullata]|uniref:ryncolin-1-like isoform X1 n=1 Tax=Saccostrea cuccullata TaxID=36930 RepID=UPI002ED2FFE6